MTVKRTRNCRSVHCVIYQQAMHTLEEFLFQLGLCDLNLNSLIHLLGVSALMVCVILDGGGEEGVDEGRLS
jgi:hypothetical protein